MDPLQKFLKALRERREKRPTQNAHGYGITTADSYLREFQQCAGDEVCNAHLQSLGCNEKDWSALVKEAADKPTYCSDKTLIDQKSIITNSSNFKDVGLKDDFTLPPRTLMVFRNIITTPFIDRDGDILRTEGAEPDMKMPLLFAHNHNMIAGKMLQVIEHDKSVLRVITAVIDSKLGNDVAVLVEFGALRISHGFLPLEWEELDMEPTDKVPFPGFDILKFEIMEETVCAVPSNIEATIEAFSRGKLFEPTVKSWAKHYYDSRPLVIEGVSIKGGKVNVPSGSKDTVNVWSGTEGTVVQVVNHDAGGEKVETEPKGEGCSCDGGCEVCTSSGGAGGGSSQSSASETEPKLPEDSIKAVVRELRAAIYDICEVAKTLELGSDHQLLLRSANTHIDSILAAIDGEGRVDTDTNKPTEDEPKTAQQAAQALLIAAGGADSKILRRIASVLTETANGQDADNDQKEFAAMLRKF